MPELKTAALYAPTGDQPAAIEAISAGLAAGERYQTLLGATGTGRPRRWRGSSRRSDARRS